MARPVLVVDVAASTTTTHTAENVAMMTIGVSDQLTIVAALLRHKQLRAEPPVL